MLYVVVTAEVWNRVIEIEGEDCFRCGAGTATVVNLDGEQLLVTADHLTTGEPEENFHLRGPYLTGGRAAGVVLTRRAPRLEGLDVAVFNFPYENEAIQKTHLAVGSDGMAMSQDVYLLGHPYGLHLQLDRSVPSLNLPLAKKGIVAGAKWIDGNHMIFADVIANPGFSGGPAVLRLNHGQGDWTLIGVVKGQFMQKSPVNAVGDEADEPAGITAITDIHNALERLGIR